MFEALECCEKVNRKLTNDKKFEKIGFARFIPTRNNDFLHLDGQSRQLFASFRFSTAVRRSIVSTESGRLRRASSKMPRYLSNVFRRRKSHVAEGIEQQFSSKFNFDGLVDNNMICLGYSHA